MKDATGGKLTGERSEFFFLFQLKKNPCFFRPSDLTSRIFPPIPEPPPPPPPHTHEKLETKQNRGLVAQVPPVGGPHPQARRRDGRRRRRRRGLQEALHQRARPRPGRRVAVVLLGRTLLPDVAGDRRVGLGDGERSFLFFFPPSSRSKERERRRERKATHFRLFFSLSLSSFFFFLGRNEKKKNDNDDARTARAT